MYKKNVHHQNEGSEHTAYLSLDFKSLKNNDAWQKTLTYYLAHAPVFDKLILRLSKLYNIDSSIARDAIWYELFGTYYNKSLRYAIQEKKSIKWIFIYNLTLIGVLCSGIIGFFFNLFKQNIQVDILYEEMWTKKSWFSRFYHYIDKELNPNLSKAILFIHPNISKIFSGKNIEGWNGTTINHRYKSLIFKSSLAFFIFYKELLFAPQLYNLSSNINATALYLRILRRILMYGSQVEYIKAKIIIAAGDYYWNPIKYAMYKTTIDQIFLIQHNFKNEYLYNRLFQYCDHYFAHSYNAINKMEGSPYAMKHAVGSFQLIPFLDASDISYDILFINQPVYDNYKQSNPLLDQSNLIKQYHQLINNFHQFLIKHPNLSCLYVSKPGDAQKMPVSAVQTMFQNLPNVHFREAYGKDIFKLISQSKLLLNMYSSLGFEAYGLDKKVLWINYGHCCDSMKYDTEDEALHILIEDDSFTVFEERVLQLLSENPEITNHYQQLKQKYMNLQENPAKRVAEIVQNNLST